MRKLMALALMLSIVLVAQYMAWRQRSAVPVTHALIAETPADYYQAADGAGGVVLVVHGYAGNKELMKHWGYYLARQGFDAYVVDQPGHGASQQRLPDWRAAGNDDLGANLRRLIDELVKTGRAEPGRIALIGHSMGGAAVTSAALADDRVKATVAVSSAYRGTLTVGSPINLLSLAAERDPPFIVESVEAMAVQQADGWQAGVVPGRNHITILYDAGVMKQAVEWISAGLGAGNPVSGAASGFGWQWVALALVGALAFVLAAAFFLAPPPPARGAARSNQVRIGLLTAVFLVGTAALSAVLAVVYVRIHWLGMGVVEYLLPYFLSMAVVLLLLRTFWPQDYGFPVAGELTSNLGQVLRGIGIFLGLVGALGSVVHMSLSNFMLNGPRILPFMGLALAFWLYFAQEEGLKRAVAGSLGPWAAGLVGLTAKLLMVGTWLLAAALPNPQPFLPLVTPIIAVLMLLLEALSYALHLLRYSSAGAATCTALTLAWITAASFPLV